MGLHLSRIPDRRSGTSAKRQVFLQWFRLGLFLKPEWRSQDLHPDETRDSWREHIGMVESTLGKDVTGSDKQAL